MAEFSRDIGGPSLPSQTVTPMVAPNTKKQVLASALGNALDGFVSGAATGMIARDVKAATGAGVSSEEVDKRVAGFGARMEEAQAAGPMTPNTYQELSGQYLSEMDADAKTILKLVQKGQMSTLQGEAFTRKRVSEALANPFWAALGGKITRAAGPLGGGSNVALDAYTTPEYQMLQSMAEGQRKAIEEYEKEVTGISQKTGYPVDVVKGYVQRRAQFEEQQKNEVVGVQQSFNRTMDKAFFQVSDTIANLINPETGLLDGNSLATAQNVIAQSEAEQIAAVNGLNLPDADKKAKIDLIREQHKALGSLASTRSKLTVTQELQKQTEAELKLMGTQIDPWRTMYSMTGNTAMLNMLSTFDRAQVNAEIERMYGKEAVSSMMQAGVMQSARLIGASEGTFQPQAVTGLMLNSPGISDTVKRAQQENPSFDKNIVRQARKHPVETLRGIREGEIARTANGGDYENRKTVASSVNAVVTGVLSDLEFLGDNGSGFGARVSVNLKRTPGGTVVGASLNVPDEMQDRGTELGELWKLVKSSPWMWPQIDPASLTSKPNALGPQVKNAGTHMAPMGLESAAKAFEAIVNGEHQVSAETAQETPKVKAGAMADPATAGFASFVEGIEGNGQVASPVAKAASRSNPVDEVKSSLLEFEGARGDKATKVKTGKKGMTAATKKSLIDQGVIKEGATDEQAIDAYLNQLHTKTLPEKLNGYDKLSADSQAAVLDAMYNMGEGFIDDSPNFRKAIEEGDVVKAGNSLLQSANIKGKASKGVAKRRAATVNKLREAAGEELITEVEVKKDGTVIYRDAEGDTVLTYKASGGLHSASIPGVVEVD